MKQLTNAERSLLEWIAAEEFAQYGECHGKTLDSLSDAGLVFVHGPGEHQSGFIAQDPTGKAGIAYRAVSLTEAGRRVLRGDVDGIAP